MATNYSPKIPSNNLKFYFDVSNRKCIDAGNTSIVGELQGTHTELKCLVSDLRMKAYDNTNDNMRFVLDNGQYCYEQVSTNGGEPGWRANATIARVDDYTFVCWFKYNYGLEYQRAENIYGGGFGSVTSFYLSPGGTSNFHGALRYSQAGGTNSYSVGRGGTTGIVGNDGEWHMFATTDTGGDGNQTTKVYIDGNLVATGNSNASHDTPDTIGLPVWGSWSGTYGNFGGRTNCFMYYERVLSQNEIISIYNATKSRFQT